MKQRLGMIWMALLTAYMAIITTDMYNTLRSVDSCQESTLRYMQKTAKILKRIKHADMISKKEADRLEAAEQLHAEQVSPESSESSENVDQAELSQGASNDHT